MKAIKSIILFLCTVFLPGAMIFLLFNEDWFIIVLGLYLILWGVLFIFVDKLTLMTLGAREVIETDEHELFQSIKNLSYISFDKQPRLYLYSGLSKNIFIFEARNEWAIVIDRELLKILKSEQIHDFVKMVFDLKRSNIPWIQTKTLGIVLLLKQLIYWSFRKLFSLNGLSYLYHAFTIFSLGMLKPFVFPLEYLAVSKKRIVLPENLKPLLYQVENHVVNHSEHLLDHLVGEVDSRKWSLTYLESFSILKNCRFDGHES